MKTLVIVALVVLLLGIVSGKIGLTPTAVQVANWVIEGAKTAVAGIQTWVRQ